MKLKEHTPLFEAIRKLNTLAASVKKNIKRNTSEIRMSLFFNSIISSPHQPFKTLIFIVVLCSNVSSQNANNSCLSLCSIHGAIVQVMFVLSCTRTKWLLLNEGVTFSVWIFEIIWETQSIFFKWIGLLNFLSSKYSSQFIDWLIYTSP
jgi:hypothetical protein